MTALDTLHRLAQSYTLHSCAGLVVCDVTLDPAYYDRSSLQVTGQTPAGTVTAALREMRRHRNGRPRLVSVTSPGERGEVAA